MRLQPTITFPVFGCISDLELSYTQLDHTEACRAGVVVMANGRWLVAIATNDLIVIPNTRNKKHVLLGQRC
jgi:hypothetical protein